MIQHMMPHMIHLWSASKTCYWNFVQTLKVEMKCKHILMFPVVLTSANITSSLYYLLVNLKWCFQTNPKAKNRNTLPFIPNNQEAGHWVSFPIVLLLFIPDYIRIIYPYIQSCIANFKLCTFPSSQIAASGSPIGLIKNAINNKINPFCGEYIINTATPNKARIMLISPRTRPDT